MGLLEAAGVTVAFGGLRALDDVSIQVDRSMTTGLIGPNGAGKSTLLAVLSGLIKPSHGRVFFDGRDVSRAAPHRRAAMGLSRTFQRLELWNSMTVEENVRTAAEFARRWRNDIQPDQVTEDLLGRLDLTGLRRTPAGALPAGLARLTEVARALATKPKLVLLDEPSAGLDDQESAHLAKQLVSVTGSGVAILLVEHNVEMVFQCCSSIWVLDFGRIIAQGAPDAIRKDKIVQVAYLGANGDAGA